MSEEKIPKFIKILSFFLALMLIVGIFIALTTLLFFVLNIFWSAGGSITANVFLMAGFIGIGLIVLVFVFFMLFIVFSFTYYYITAQFDRVRLKYLMWSTDINE